ncbi:retrovirus-related pol polyprotein from transposon TNT 1-94 [Tanacetum coccineum]
MDKEVNQAARNSDDALVHLANDNTLDIAGIEDVVLKSSFGTSWTLKDVRYIPSLKRRLISVGQLDEEGYPVGFKDQQWKVTKGSLVVAQGNKRVILYMVEIGMSMLASEDNVPDVRKVDIYFCKPGGLGIMSVKTRKLQSRSYGRAESTGLRVEVLKMLWADSVSTSYLIYRIPYVPIGLRIPEEEWQGKDTNLTHLKAETQMKCDTAFGIRRVTRLSEAEILHLWTRFMEPRGSSDTSEGSENIGSFEDNGRSDEEDSKDGTSSKEGGSKTLQVRRFSRESKAPIRYSPSPNYLLLIDNGESESYSEALKEQNSSKRYKAQLVVKGFQQKRRVYYNEIFSLVVKITTISWAERKPRVQIKGNSIQTDSSTEAKAPTWQNSTSLSGSCP